MATALRLGTRRSALAAGAVRAGRAGAGRGIRSRGQLVPIVSEGDTIARLPRRDRRHGHLRDAPARGPAERRVRPPRALPERPAHRAAADGLVIAATPVREDARDVVVTRDGTPLHDLPAGSVVGTGSPRRVAQVHRRTHRVTVRRHPRQRRLPRRPRARRRAGCRDPRRRRSVAGSRAPPPTCSWRSSASPNGRPPRGRDRWPSRSATDAPDDLRAALALLDDARRASAVTAERAVLRRLEAGCHAPIAAHAALSGDDRAHPRGRLRPRRRATRSASTVTVPLLTGGIFVGTGSGNGADAADGADPIVRAARARDRCRPSAARSRGGRPRLPRATP